MSAWLSGTIVRRELGEDQTVLPYKSHCYRCRKIRMRKIFSSGASFSVETYLSAWLPLYSSYCSRRSAWCIEPSRLPAR